MHQAAFARALRRGPAGIEPVGRGDREQADVAPVLRHQADGGDRFRRDGAAIGHDHLRVRPRLAQPIGAVDDLLAQLRRHRALDLFDRPRRQPQIDRAAGLVAQPIALGGRGVAILLHVGEGPAQNDGQLVDIGRLERGQPVLRQSDQRLGDRLVRAAFARQRDAGRRRHQNEARILVAGVIERIEPARDEGIVQRADRQQPLAVDRMRQAERREQDEQVILGDAELDVLALGRELPIEGRRDVLALEGVGHLPRARTIRAGLPRARDWWRR